MPVQAKVGELVRSKQLDASLEPMLYAKSTAHRRNNPLRDRRIAGFYSERTRTGNTWRALAPAPFANCVCWRAVGNRDAHVLMVWTVYQVRKRRRRRRRRRRKIYSRLTQ